MATSHKADLDKRISQPPPLLIIPLGVHSILLHHGAPLVHMVMPMLVAVLMTVLMPMRMLMAVLMLLGLAVALAVAVGVLVCGVLPLLRDEAAATLGVLELALQLLLGARLQPGLQQAVACSLMQALALQLMQGGRLQPGLSSGTFHKVNMVCY